MAIRAKKHATESLLKISIEGEINIYRAQQLKNELVLALNSCKELELNLENVNELDSAGLQVLALLKKEAQRSGKALRLTAHSSVVLEVMNTLQLTHFFDNPPDLPANTEQPA